MPSIEFEVYCEQCGNLLKGESVRDSIEIEPCEKCLKTAREEGHEEGYNERDQEEEK